jgi:hypothetical protein
MAAFPSVPTGSLMLRPCRFARNASVAAANVKTTITNRGHGNGSRRNRIGNCRGARHESPRACVRPPLSDHGRVVPRQHLGILPTELATESATRADRAMARRPGTSTSSRWRVQSKSHAPVLASIGQDWPGNQICRCKLLILNGGEGGIRTHGGVTPSTVFETARFNHSRTSPQRVDTSIVADFGADLLSAAPNSATPDRTPSTLEW